MTIEFKNDNNRNLYILINKTCLERRINIVYDIETCNDGIYTFTAVKFY